MISILILGESSVRLQFIREMDKLGYLVDDQQVSLYQVRNNHDLTIDALVNIDFQLFDHVIYLCSGLCMDDVTSKILRKVPNNITIDFYDPEADGCVADFIKSIHEPTQKENSQTLPGDLCVSQTPPETVDEQQPVSIYQTHTGLLFSLPRELHDDGDGRRHHVFLKLSR